VRREELEGVFVEHLRTAKPDRDTIANFPKVAERVWARKQADAEASEKRTRARLNEYKRLKSELLLAKLRGEINQSDYALANSEFDRECGALEEQLQAAGSNPVTLEDFMGFVNAMLVDLARAWLSAKAEQRVRVQNLLFQNSLRYSQTSRSFERPKPCLFNTLEETSGQNWWLASPTGFEPVLPP
jgi:hypothetical protein